MVKSEVGGLKSGDNCWLLFSGTAGLFGVETRSYCVSWLGWNLFADQARLNLGGSRASTSKVLGLKVQGSTLKIRPLSKWNGVHHLAGYLSYQLRVFHV